MMAGAEAWSQDVVTGETGAQTAPRVRLLKAWDDSVMVNGQYEVGTSSCTSVTRRESRPA